MVLPRCCNHIIIIPTTIVLWLVLVISMDEGLVEFTLNLVLPDGWFLHEQTDRELIKTVIEFTVDSQCMAQSYCHHVYYWFMIAIVTLALFLGVDVQFHCHQDQLSPLQCQGRWGFQQCQMAHHLPVHLKHCTQHTRHIVILIGASQSEPCINGKAMRKLCIYEGRWTYIRTSVHSISLYSGCT